MAKFDVPREPDTAVGVQLQNLRIFRSLSRDAAAERIGVSPGVLEAVEGGRIRPSSDLLLDMARIYEVPPSRVFAICEAMQDPDQEARP